MFRRYKEFYVPFAKPFFNIYNMKKYNYKRHIRFIFYYLCDDMPYKVNIYSKGDTLPQMTCHNFFHSVELFHIIEKTPAEAPYMAVAVDEDGRARAHMLAITRRKGSLLPPYLYMQGRIYGEGEYDKDVDREEVFGLLLHAVTRKLRRRLCLYIEFSDLSRKMFGYKLFRREGYFPINWQEVHNSLHSIPPEERLTPRLKNRIEHVYKLGVETREAASLDEVHEFYKVLRNFYKMKVRRLIPPEEQVKQLYESKNGQVFVTLFRKKVIGGCLCVFSEGNVYLWYLAARRKTYAPLHPNLMTIWQALKWSWEHKYNHLFFLDVGLPLPHNRLRDFILSFGGKPVARYRWFLLTIGWANRLIRRIYRE